MIDAQDLYKQIHGSEPDTKSQDYKDFCLLIHRVKIKIRECTPREKYAEGEETKVWRILRGW